MQDQFSRSRMLMGDAAISCLQNSHVAVFGVGGVGGFAVEALARAGVGTLSLFDHDRVCKTNLNRQIIATHQSIGAYKVALMKTRILEINPNAQVYAHQMFVTPETALTIDFTQFDYIMDAIDTVTSKIELVKRAKAVSVPIICAMGAANKLDPTAFTVSDIHKTEGDALARVMRRELRALCIKQVKVVYSKEQAKTPLAEFAGECGEACTCGKGAAAESVRRQTPSSASFVPGVAGMILAGEVIKDLTGIIS